MLEKRVRLPPALLKRGRSSVGERSLVERQAVGSIPIVPASREGRGVADAFEAVILAAPFDSGRSSLARGR